MNKLPAEVSATIWKEALKHPDDIEAAVVAAIRAIQWLPVYEVCVPILVGIAVRESIHDARSNANEGLRCRSGDYGGPAKVAVGKAASRIGAELYGYMIAGVTLGNIRGEQLKGIGQAEAARADGHRFNSRLCETLQPLVKDEKTVRECLSGTKLRKIFSDLQATPPS